MSGDVSAEFEAGQDTPPKPYAPVNPLRDRGVGRDDDDEEYQVEEPIEDRLRRAWLNGFWEGLNHGIERGTRGGWDR